MNKIILKALELGLWRSFDIQFAYTLVEPHQYSLVLSIVTLSFYVNRGHVCLPLVMINPKQLFCGSHIILATEACEKFGNFSIDYWHKILFNSSVVSDGSYLAPLILDKKKLYFYHMWENECLVSNFFYLSLQQSFDISKDKKNQIIKLLDEFFPFIESCKNGKIDDRTRIDWQKVAIAMILTRKMVVISGGPGTGKTSIVAKLLIIMSLLNSNTPLTVVLAAPTGKSAARLNESIRLTIKNLSLANEDYTKSCFSVQAITLHRLLGLYSSNKQNLKRAQCNFLFLDYLIIDECSMIDLSIFSKIITCLSPKTKIVLLGDHKQLPSVEPGSVFSDICYFIGHGYTSKYFKQLRELTNYTVPINKYSQHSIFDGLCLLNKNYRFDAVSGIGKLAHAISVRDQYCALSLLTGQKSSDLNYIVLKNYEDYSNMLFNCALKYVDYFKKIIHNYKYYKNLEYILNFFNRYRVLCVLREGPFGVSELNFLIEKILYEFGLIYLEDDSQNYIGRPIIITSNKPSLPLFNGEVGIILPDNDNMGNSKKLCAYFFSLENKNIKKILLCKLPKHETNFVMTVHKAQGSEFDFVTLILPDKSVPILTNELFYTGVTRARKHLLIYARDQIISDAVNNLTKRCSGLMDRLNELIDLNL